MKWIGGVVVVLFVLLTALANLPVGKPMASYKSDWQQFSWGKMYAWVAVTQIDVSGTLLINFSFARNILKKGCALSMSSILLKDPVNGVNLIDIEDIEVYWNGIWNYTQWSGYKFEFEFDRHNFPYDLNIELDLDCNGVQESFTFSEPLEFRMVQPRLGGQ